MLLKEALPICGFPFPFIHAPTYYSSFFLNSSLFLTLCSQKITYWDAYDGTAIRVIEGGDEEMNTLDVEPSGEAFVSGGDDGLVKVCNRSQPVLNTEQHAIRTVSLCYRSSCA